MGKTIAINAGSSSLKWQLYAMPEETVIAKGLIERIGLPESVSTIKFDGKEEQTVANIENHDTAIQILLDDLIKHNIIASYDEITGAGHRVVAGGEIFKESAVVTPKVIEQIEALATLAPLHNPANAAGIKAFYKLLPNITSVAVFDTAFHTTMPPVAFRYPVPEEFYTKHHVRKYGAHGTSHMYVSQKAADMLGKDIDDLKLITCHIGNGGSITAVRHGRSIDTSMGFTPLGGIMMGTRSGDLDPSMIPYMMEKAGVDNCDDIIEVLNKHSGLQGVSGLSSDMRDIINAKNEGDEKALLAFEMYCDRIRKYIGQYIAVLNGVDAIIFTAGVGENSPWVREAVINRMSWFGMKLDRAKNEEWGVEGIISTEDSKVKVMVVPTDEELVIARDVEHYKNMR